MLNAMEMVDSIRLVKNLPPTMQQLFDYQINGMGLVLRVVDIRTYGGQVRLYCDEEGNPVDTGSTTVPMRIRRPFRLAPQTAYVVKFQLEVTDLPENIVARVVPTPKAAEMGILMTESFVTDGEVTVTILPLRMIEITEGYPLALLTFDIKSEVEFEDESES